jgi:tetratricopeptide (TPR) repeat protein
MLPSNNLWCFGFYLGGDHKRQPTIFLACGMFMTRMKDQPSIELLEEAHKLLEWLCLNSYYHSYQSTAEYARVKYLLGTGDNDEEIEKLFKDAISSSTRFNTKYKINAYTLLGRFYEKCNRKEEAILKYEEAVSIRREENSSYSSVNARNRLKELLGWRYRK